MGNMMTRDSTMAALATVFSLAQAPLVEGAQIAGVNLSPVTQL